MINRKPFHQTPSRLGSTRAARRILTLMLPLLLLITNPLPAVAAPLAQLTLPKKGSATADSRSIEYAHPDGLFTLSHPADFTYIGDGRYADIAEAPLPGLLNDIGYAFASDEYDGGLGILFLLLEEPVSDEDEWIAFLEAFKQSFGGDDMMADEFTDVLDDSFVPQLFAQRDGNTSYLRMLPAENDLVIVWFAAGEDPMWDEHGEEMLAAFVSFSWSSDVAYAQLHTGGDAPALTLPETNQEPAELPLSFERYANPDATFSLDIPTGYSVRWMQGIADRNSSRYGFELPINPALHTVMVDFVMPGQLLVGTADYPATAIDDEEWLQLSDILISQWLGDGEALVDIRNDRLRTGYVNLHRPEPEMGDLDIRLWYEERDGVLASLIVAGSVETDAAILQQIFDTAYGSFAWHPAGAAFLLELDAGDQPYEPPVLVDTEDPMLLLWPLAAPVDYPLVSATQTRDGLDYRFGTNPSEEGGFLMKIDTFADAAFSEEEWADLIDETIPVVLDLAGGPDGDAQLTVQELDVLPAEEPTYGNPITNSALIVAESETDRSAILLQGMDGLLVLIIGLAPSTVWDERLDQFDAVLTAPVPIDPARVNQQLGLLSDFAGTPEEILLMDAESQQRAVFANDETILIQASFPDGDQLVEQFNLEVFAPWDFEEPWIAYALDLGEQEPYEGRDFVISQVEDGATQVTFGLHPDPLPYYAGSYRARLHYDGITLGQLNFMIRNERAHSAESGQFVADIALTDESYVAPLVSALRFQPDDTTVVRATGDIPADSQVRLLITDGNGWLPFYTETFYAAIDLAYFVDWLSFYPDLSALEGPFTAIITVNGDRVWSQEFLGVSPETELSADGDDLETLYELILPPDYEPIDVPEAVDVGVATKLDGANALDRAAVWLRSRGWRATLPLPPLETTRLNRRWVRDGDEFIIEVVQDSAEPDVDGPTQLWYSVRAIDPELTSPPPAQTPITAGTIFDAVPVGELGISDATVTGVAMSPDGNWLAVTSDAGNLAILDARTLSTYQWFTAPGDQPGDVDYTRPTFSPDSNRLAVALNGQGQNTVLVLEYGSTGMWERSGTFGGHRQPVNAILFVDGSRQILTAGCDGTLRSWWHEVYLATQLDFGSCLTDLAFSPDGAHLFAAQDDGTVQLYAFHPDEDPSFGAFKLGDSVSVERSDPRVVVYPQLVDEQEGQVLFYNGDAAPGEIDLYEFNPAEFSYAAGIPLETPSALPGRTGVTIDPSGSLLVTAEGAANFIDVIEGEYLGEWYPGDGHEEGAQTTVTSIKFSPDGRYLLVLGEDDDLHLWAVPAGTE